MVIVDRFQFALVPFYFFLYGVFLPFSGLCLIWAVPVVFPKELNWNATRALRNDLQPLQPEVGTIRRSQKERKKRKKKRKERRKGTLRGW